MRGLHIRESCLLLEYQTFHDALNFSPITSSCYAIAVKYWIRTKGRWTWLRGEEHGLCSVFEGYCHTEYFHSKQNYTICKWYAIFGVGTQLFYICLITWGFAHSFDHKYTLYYFYAWNRTKGCTYLATCSTSHNWLLHVLLQPTWWYLILGEKQKKFIVFRP